MGIIVDAGGLLITFELDESHRSWPKVQHWIAARRPVDVVRTEFSKQELASAKSLELVPSWHHGYPQPDEGVFGYLAATYDLSEYCQECGTGLKQKAPFQMKAKPKWGRNGILQLNWTSDEYFATPEVLATVFEPHGVRYREVLNTRELKGVVQLVVERQINILTGGLPGQTCARCGRVKYLPLTRGPSPPLAGAPAGHMVKTGEYFGSGGSARKGVLISQDLANALASANVRGASVRPVAEQ